MLPMLEDKGVYIAKNGELDKVAVLESLFGILSDEVDLEKAREERLAPCNSTARICGLSHITFIVKDLNRSAAFWKAVFDAEEVYDSGDDTFSVAREKFFVAGGVWIALMEGKSLSASGYGHVAFSVDEASLDCYSEKIKSLGLVVESGRPRVAGEGKSIYFRDFDGYLFELHSGTLEKRLERYSEIARS